MAAANKRQIYNLMANLEELNLYGGTYATHVYAAEAEKPYKRSMLYDERVYEESRDWKWLRHFLNHLNLRRIIQHSHQQHARLAVFENREHDADKPRKSRGN